MDYLFYWIIIILIIFIFFAFLYFNKNKHKLSKDDYSKYSKLLNRIFTDNVSNKEKIMDIDKLYHKILITIWYNWSFWEILKQNPKKIKDINKIWDLHKLRNKLAHDFDKIDESVLYKKLCEYKTETQNLLNNLK